MRHDNHGGIYGMNPYTIGLPGCGGCCDNYARFKVVADKGGLGCCNEEVGNIRYVRKDRSVWIYDPCDPNATDCGWVCIFSGVSMYDLIDNLDGSFTLTENGEPKTTIDMNPYFQKYFKNNILSKIVTLTNGDGATVDIYDKSYIDGEINRINNAITNIQGDITDIQGDITNIQGDITNIENNLGDTVTGVTTTLSSSDVLTTTVQTDDGSYSDTTDLSSLGEGSTPDLQAVLDAGNVASNINTVTRISGLGHFEVLTSDGTDQESALKVHQGITKIESDDTLKKEHGYLNVAGNAVQTTAYNSTLDSNATIAVYGNGAISQHANNGSNAFADLALNPTIGGVVQPMIRMGVSTISALNLIYTNIDINGVELPNWRAVDFATLPDTHAVSKSQITSVKSDLVKELSMLEKTLLDEIGYLKERLDTLEKTT